MSAVVITASRTSGTTHQPYFDITSFYGRYDHDGSLEDTLIGLNQASLTLYMIRYNITFATRTTASYETLSVVATHQHPYLSFSHSIKY